MLPFNSHPLHSAKEIRGHPLFRGAISRWVWRLVTHRLTRPGQWFVAMTLAFALYGATSLDLQVFVPFTYALSIWFLALAWAQIRAPDVTISARYPPRVEVGRVLPVTVQVRANKGTVYDGVLLPSRLPPAVDLTDWNGAALETLRPGETQTVSLELTCTRRGLHTLPGFRVQTDFPFGLLRAYTVAVSRGTVLATPRWTPLRELYLPLRRSEQPGGAALATARGEALEFIGNREFREGDNIRDMDWRASARLDRLVVREFHDEYLHRIGLILDTCVFNVQQEEAALENAVSLCAAAVDFAVRHEYTVSTLLAGPVLHIFDGQAAWACREQIMDLLAVVPASKSTPLFENVPGLAERMEDVSIAICFLMDWDSARQALAAEIAAQGTPLRLVLVRDNGPTLDPSADEARFGPILRLTSLQFESGLDRF